MRDLGVSELGAGRAFSAVSGRAGLRPLALLVCVYAAGAAIQQPQTFTQLLLDYLRIAVPPACCAIALALAVLLLRRGGRRELGLAALLRGRAGFGAAALLLLALGLAAFTTYKLMIPSLMPFVWDAPFDRLDRTLHGGAPWQVTHAVLPYFLEEVIGTLDGAPWFLYWFGTFAFVVFCVAEPLRSRYLWALALTFGLLGTLAATAFASHGPIFFPDFMLPGYDGLIDTLRESALGRQMLDTADYLYAAYATGKVQFGSGISAMPSMHVAVVTLNFCLYATLRRALGVLALVFVLLIGIGSVHFGWHYAIDGYVSLAVVPLLWWLAGRLSRRRGEPAAVSAPA